MKNSHLGLALILALMPEIAVTQYNTRQNIDVQCYGGRNQMGLHVCTCDQGWISGAAALSLGNVVRLYGPGSQQNCLAWANEMNGVGESSDRVTPPSARKEPLQANVPQGLGDRASVTPPSVPSSANASLDLAKVETPKPKPVDLPDWAGKTRLHHNWVNTEGKVCTNTIHFSYIRLRQEAFVDRVESFINWSEAGPAPEAKWSNLNSGDSKKITFRRGECSVPSGYDDWCAGSANIKEILPPGQYSVNISKPVLCRNEKTGNEGFTTVWGTYDTDKVRTLMDDAETPTQDVADATEDTDAAATSPTEHSRKLFDNWNTGGCSSTTTSEFALTTSSRIHQLKTWLNWSALPGGTFIAKLFVEDHPELTKVLRFSKGNCHPTMPDWCYGETTIGDVYPSGSFTVDTMGTAICMNAASGNNGYMQVFGSRVKSSLPALPDYNRPPDLGMPGNRSGSARGRYSRFGPPNQTGSD